MEDFDVVLAVCMSNIFVLTLTEVFFCEVGRMRYQ